MPTPRSTPPTQPRYMPMLPLIPEYRSLPAGVSVYGAYATYSQDFANSSILTEVEIPMLSAYRPGLGTNVGLGDLRSKVFYLPYQGGTGLLQAFAVNLDITAPTGDMSKGLGTGTWVLMPAVVGKLHLADHLSWYPFLRGLLSTRGTESIRQFQSENPFVWEDEENGRWYQINPITTYNFAPAPGANGTRLDIKLQVGQMLTERLGIGLEGTKFVAGQEVFDYQIKFLTFYYF